MKYFTAKYSVLSAALVGSAAAALWSAGSFAQASLPAGPFTQAQLDAGRSAYIGSCMACHGDTMSGSGEAPPIAGRAFMAAYGNVTTRDLFGAIKGAMPYGAAGSLPDATYTNIVAFLLHASGAKAGTTALTPTTAVKISTVANGTVAPEVTQGLKAAPAAPPARPAQAAGAAGAAPAGENSSFNAAAAARAGLAEVDRAGGALRAATEPGLIAQGKIDNYQPVTDEMLTHPSPSDWLMYRGNYAGWSYSALDQINAANVNQLQLKWSLAMNDGGTNETTPIIHNGVMFLVSAGNTVQAINAVNGEIIWEHFIGPAPRSLNPGSYAEETRSIALYNDKVIVPTPQGKLYGLDAATGKIVWQTWISDPANPAEGQRGNTGGVIVAKGKAIVGLIGCARIPQKDHCYISAYDANTGKRVWKFITVADKGEPGGDTWGGLPNDQRAGGETWIAGTFDPDLNTTYWGIAQSKPWRRDLRGSGDGETLYANSTVALDVDTGKLKWHFNHVPGETFDLDEVYERILIDHGGQKTAMTTGKVGITWKLDRVTGKYLDSRQNVFQNIYTKIDAKTGTPTYRKDIINQKLQDWLPTCPGPEGGKNWPAASYHPSSDTMIIPLSQSCVLMWGSGAEQYYEMPGSEGNMGRLSALRTDTMKPLWTLQQRSPFLTGVVTTAGNVAFVGDFDRVFHAFDVRSGKQLWTTRLGTTVQGHIASYAVNGKQYIAVMTGLGGGSPQSKPTFMLKQEVNRPAHGTEMYVFALPDSPQVSR